VCEQDLCSGRRLRIFQTSLIARHAQIPPAQPYRPDDTTSPLTARLQPGEFIGDGFQPGAIEPA
jgi:hypothetical protein